MLGVVDFAYDGKCRRVWAGLTWAKTLKEVSPDDVASSNQQAGHEHGAGLKTKSPPSSMTNMSTSPKTTSRPDQITSTGREDGNAAPRAPSCGRKARIRAPPEQELSRTRRQATTEETRFDHGTSRTHGGSKTRDEEETPEEKAAREQGSAGRNK